MSIAGILGGYEFLIILVLLLALLLLPQIAIIDIVRSEFEGNNKLVWVLVVIFLTFHFLDQLFIS